MYELMFESYSGSFSEGEFASPEEAMAAADLSEMDEEECYAVYGDDGSAWYHDGSEWVREV